MYSCENEHYDLCLRKQGGELKAVLKLNIGGIKHTQAEISLGNADSAKLIVRSAELFYNFYVQAGGWEHELGFAQSKYLSSEVSGGFTGAMLGLYAVDAAGNSRAEFKNFELKYE